MIRTFHKLLAEELRTRGAILEREAEGVFNLVDEYERRGLSDGN
jgi:hypothetical protein